MGLLRLRRRPAPRPAPVELRDRTEMANGSLLAHHLEGDCVGEHCPFHKPSDHLMVGWPMVWRSDRYLLERLCPHRVGHPDPDSVAFLAARGVEGADVHGCDGCCATQACGRQQVV